MKARAPEEHQRSSSGIFDVRPMQAARALLVVFATCAAMAMTPERSMAQENAQKEFTFDIERQALTPAIHEFSSQTGLNVGYFPEDEAEENTLVGPVQGTFTAEAALDELLSEAGFAHEWLNKKSIYVFKQKASPTKGAANATATSQATASSHSERRWPGGRSQYDDVDSVIVMGTRISSLATESQPVAVLNRPRIDAYGVSTLAELFEYLPQIPFMRAEHVRLTGEQFADLRGFGFGTTMILINGRRVSGTATSFDYGGFDVNSIPLTAVKRVEVLLDTPSIAIGTDTLAGVINIVLNDDIPEPMVELRYGAADGGAEERRMSAGIGTTREAFRGTVTFDIFQRNSLLGAEREPIRNQDYRRFGGLDYRSLRASPGNVFSTTSANLPGLDSRFAAIPAGSSGIDLTPEDFASTAGDFARLNRTSLGRFLSIVPRISRSSIVASTELKLSSSLVAFGEVFGVSKEVERQEGPPTLSKAVVPEANAFNPFGAPVAVDALLEGAPTRAATTHGKFIRALAGVRGDWNSWEWEIAATWMEDRATYSRGRDLDPSRLAQALSSSDPSTALNLFRDGPAGTKTLLESLLAPPQVRKYSTTTTQGYARAEGPVLSTLAGDVRLLVGSEWRREELANPSLPDSPHQSVSAVFAELHAPLIDPGMNIRIAHDLAVNLGVRIDNYNSVGSVDATQYGLVWRPLRDIKLRASYSESYRPPLLYELYGPRISSQLSLPDPRRGQGVSSFTATYAGNSDLIPTKGRTWTAGVEFTPETLSQFHLSIGFWRTTLADRIVPLSLLEVLANEELFPGRVIREAPSPLDVASGMPGAIRSIDTSWGNFGQLVARGIDLSLSLSMDTNIGTIRPNLSATWNDQFKTTLTQGVLPEDRIGMAHDLGTIPQWRATASTAWTHGALTAFVAMQYVPSYDDTFVDRTITGRSIPSTTLFDVQASLRVGDVAPRISLLSAVEFTVGIKNIFDKKAHFSEAGWEYGYDPYQGDLRQRFWYLRLAKAF